jgi:NNP family nitrate/nitrite transporter-like MFS transporter
MVSSNAKATQIELLDFKSVPMRAFHVTWLSFLVCFAAWFATAPLMPVIREEFHLTKEQIGNIMIASMSATVLLRLLLGFVCDRLGPRITYTALLLIGAIPVMAIGFSDSYESFLFWRVLIGGVGASFVLTQYHTSVMFAPNVVGTANATAAGWGNLGGGLAQMMMPFLFSLLVGLGLSASMGWRVAMIVPGAGMLLCAFLYWKFTQDTPKGNFAEIRRDNDKKSSTHGKTDGPLWKSFLDTRLLSLAVLYGACFGVELTVYSSASLYFTDKFHLGLQEAGIIAGLHGLLNIFARALGGILGDRFGLKFGLRGRTLLLGLLVLLEGLGLVVFSLMTHLLVAIIVMMAFSLCVQMACGATYSIVPFLNRKRIGVASGIIGAGGNIGAIATGFLFRLDMPIETIYGITGMVVATLSVLALRIRFSAYVEAKERSQIHKAMASLHLGASSKVALGTR